MMKTLRLWPGVIAALSLAVLVSNARAVELISNLDGNDGSQTGNVNENRAKGMGFTMPAGSDYLLDIATLRLETFGDNVAPIVEIWNDDGGLPTVPLITLSNPSFASSGIANYDFTPGVSFTLSANTTYWLVAYGEAGADQFNWKANDPGVEPTGIATHAGSLFGATGPPPAFSSGILNSYALNGTVVPEPGAGLLLLFGLTVLSLRRSTGHRSR